MASLQLQPPATMDDLPSDVLSNIFIRLFAKQLAQMRSVSKSWNVLLSSSTFVKSHLHRSIHTNDKLLLFFYKRSDNFAEAIAISARPSRSPRLELDNFIKIPITLPSEGSSVIGSVNGLICVYNRSGSALHIWNPSLSAVLTLPPYSMPLCGYEQNRIRTLFRFGFDPKTDDYKIVKLESFLQEPSFIGGIMEANGISLFDVEEWLEVEVYSMRKGSWKWITQRFPERITGIFKEGEVCVDGHDGHLHWLCYIDRVLTRQVIVAFDLGEETFSEIPLPNCMRDYNVLRVNVLGVFAGRVCVMSSVVDGGCEVWVMDEYGKADSWVKGYVFGGLEPYGFTLHNEFFFETGNDRLGLYDPIAAKAKMFKIADRASGAPKVVDYVDSLVWVVPSDRDISISPL